MPNYSRIDIMGHLGRDPETKHTPQGQAVTEFSVAVTDKRKQEQVTTWYKVSAWGKLGEICAQYLTKGAAVFISGRPSVRAYVAKDGEARAEVSITAEAMQMLGGKGEQDAPAPRQAAKPAPAPSGKSGFEDMEEDIPF